MLRFIALSALIVSAFCALPALAIPTCETQTKLSATLNLPITEWVDETQPCKATIVAIHGLTFYAAAYDQLARHLAKDGFRVIAVDVRGFGRWTEPGKFNSDGKVHFGKSLDDVNNIVLAIKKDQPDEKVYLMGESLGANMALNLVSNRTSLCDGAILSAPCYKYKFHPSARLMIDVVRGAALPTRKLNLTPYVTPHLSNDKALTRDCLNDSRICRRLTPVELIKARQTNLSALNNVGNIPRTFPILVIAGMEDGVFKTRALPRLFKKFGTRELDVNLLEDKGHLLLEHQTVQPEIVSIIDRWLSKRETNERIAKPVIMDTIAHR